MLRTTSRMFLAAGVALSALAFTATAQADVKKIVKSCEAGLCPLFLPELKVPAGWQVDTEASDANGIVVLVPRGTRFGDAEALIYAKAFYNARKQTIDDRVKQSNDDWLANVTDARIKRLDDVTPSRPNAPFQLYRYDNPSKGQQSAEIVAFGEDVDKEGNTYGVQVVLTALTEEGLARSEAQLLEVLKDY